MKYLFNFLFSTNFWPGRLIMAGATFFIDLLKIQEKANLNAKHQSSALTDNRFELYDFLYFTFCVDFSSGLNISPTEDNQKIVELQHFVIDGYLQSPELKYLLSSKLQLLLRKFRENPTKERYADIQVRISVDYSRICHLLGYAICLPITPTKEKKLDGYFFALSFFTLLLTFCSIVFFSHGAIFLILSLLTCVSAYTIYFRFLKSQF